MVIAQSINHNIINIHHSNVSPGSKDLMIRCLVDSKCFVACLLGDESQRPTQPHVKHRRVF
jgi:hypothetical protein